VIRLPHAPVICRKTILLLFPEIVVSDPVANIKC
jgi:hypothetical protein